MRILASSLCVAAIAATLLDAAPAMASPEVRDHRTEGFQPAPASTRGSVRYRRRPGPRLMMPLKIDIGAAGADTVRGYAPGLALALGIHWASLSPQPTDTDVGLGVFGAVLAPPVPADSMTSNDGVVYGGVYLEAGHTLSRGSFWRTWATGRGEYLASDAFDQDHVGFGAAGRLSAELYISGVGVEPRGVFLGSYAIGVYLEAGLRDVGRDVGNFHVSGGLTFRTPLVFAL